MTGERILILELGGGHSEGIALAVRREGVDTLISTPQTVMSVASEKSVLAVIVTGKDADINGMGAQRIPAELFDLELPVLAFGYGAFALTFALMGRVEELPAPRPSKLPITLNLSSPVFDGFAPEMQMTRTAEHAVTILPRGFVSVADAPTYKNAVIADHTRRLYAFTFNPGPTDAAQIIHNFTVNVCGAECRRTSEYLKERIIDELTSRVKKNSVVIGVSGGAPSMTAARLCAGIFRERCRLVLIDHGLFRKGEIDDIAAELARDGAELVTADISDRVISALDGVTDEEQKKRAVETEIYAALKSQADAFGARRIVLGTCLGNEPVLPPPATGHAASREPLTPFSRLYRDEVRSIGRAIGYSPASVLRLPFPLAGLALQIHGNVTKDRLDAVRAADAVLHEELGKTRCRIGLAKATLYPTSQEATSYAVELTALTPGGIYGDTSIPIPYRALGRISARIKEEVACVSKVLFNIEALPDTVGTV